MHAWFLDWGNALWWEWEFRMLNEWMCLLYTKHQWLGGWCWSQETGEGETLENVDGEMWAEYILSSLHCYGEKIARITVLWEGRIILWTTAGFECIYIFIKILLFRFFSVSFRKPKKWPSNFIFVLIFIATYLFIKFLLEGSGHAGSTDRLLKA